MKALPVVIPIWDSDGVVLTGGTAQTAAAFMKAMQGEDVLISPETYGLTSIVPNKRWVVWVEDLREIPALAHEILHLTCAILESRGVTFSPKSEEAYAYTLTYILKTILDAKQKEWRKI